MRKTETVTLDGCTYRITQLKLKKARSLLLRLTNVLGPAIGDAVTEDKDKEEAQDEDSKRFTVNADSLGDAVKTLAASLNEADFEAVQDTLFEEVTWFNSNGNELPLKPYVEEHFEGGAGLGRLLKLMMEALRVNYSDFLVGLGLGDLFQVSPPQGSPQPSSGSSGE